MDSVTGQCPQTTPFLKRKESRSGIEPRSFRLPTARPNRLTFYVQKPSGLLSTGNPGRPPRLSHSSLALTEKPHCMDYRGRGAQHGSLDFTQSLSSDEEAIRSSARCCTYTETLRDRISDGEPRTATSTSTQLLRSLAVVSS